MSNSIRNTIAIFLSALVLTACGTSTPDSYGGEDTATVAEPSIADPATKDMGMQAGATIQSVIRTADLTLKTHDVESTFEKVKSVVSEFDGRIESSTYQERMDGYGPNALLTLRIPEAKLDTAIEAMSQLGTRSSTSINSSDVTLQTIDLQAKVDALKESETRLKALLAKTSSTAELIAGEQALATIRADLDSYQSQLDYLKNQVAESTLNVQIINDDLSITSGLKSFSEILISAAKGFLEGFQKAFVFIVTAIPWALVFGLLFALIRLVIRVAGQKFSGRKKFKK